MTDEKKEPTLEEKLHEYVSNWLRRTAPLMTSEHLDFATIKLTILTPQYDDDGTLLLDIKVEEESMFDTDSSEALRCPGVMFGDRKR